ncbi:MAG TPA: hypothetical protein VF191_10785 [Cyclobacteriaceae bacterium]
MPTPVVHDPRQNRHGWWGTLRFVDDKDESKIVSSVNGDDSGVQHVFVKTSREAHFVSQGTVVEIASLGDTAEATLQQLAQSGMNEKVLRLIKEDFANLDATKKTRFHEITAIDDARTSALARMLNIVTEVCFKNDHWLDCAGSIGADDIRLGRELPSLKSVEAPTV